MTTYTLITGANRGIGLELTRGLLARGAHVLAVVRKSSAELDALACPQLQVVDGIDVTDTAAPAKVQQAVGKRPLSLLIANAGILRGSSLQQLDEENIREQFAVNALAPLRLVSSLAPQLESGAKVALITSRMGCIADNSSGGSYGYRMSKAALNAAGKSLAVDLRPRNIAVGLLHPGWVQTEMTGSTGHLSASESADLLLQRIDELDLDSSGQVVHANGELLPY